MSIVPDESPVAFRFDAALGRLSAREAQTGLAVRVVGCVSALRSDEVEWIILCFSREAYCDEPPRLSGLSSMLYRKARVFGPCRRIVKIDGSALPWFVCEWGFVIPLSLRAFEVSLGSVKTKVSWRERNRMLNEHYALIKHAAVDERYGSWLAAHRTSWKDEAPVIDGPLISIISPLYKTPPEYLTEMINSVVAQTYACWELILVNASPDDEDMQTVLAKYDDPRIVVVDHPENDGITGNTNCGISASHGSYIAFLDHDDTIEPVALQSYVKAIVDSDSEIDLLYCDEDSLDGSGCNVSPLYKPERNLDLLYSNDYVIHWLMVSRRAIEKTLRSEREVDGAQDYDLTLKVMEVSSHVVRIPRILYHWRRHEGSTNVNPESKPYAQHAGRIALERHFERRKIPATVSLEDVPSTYKARFGLSACPPSVTCLVRGSITPSMGDAVDRYRAMGAACDVSVLPEVSASSVNEALRMSAGELVVVVSLDDSLVAPNILIELAGYFQRSEIACVSPRVNRLDGLIDFAGMSIAPNGYLVRMGRFLREIDGGFVGRFQRPWDMSVANSEMFIARTDCLFEVDGFDEEYDSFSYAVADVCLRMRSLGFLTVYTPFAPVRLGSNRTMLELYDAAECAQDRARLIERFGESFATCDPDQNPLLDPWSPYFKLRA